MSDRSFVQDGNIYDLMVDWDKRLAREQPFLQKIFAKKVQTVLDVGCGTGRHSIELMKNGLIVTGLDIEESMIEVAKSLSTGVNFLNCDIMDDNSLKNCNYDAIFSLGNSVALIASEYGYRAVIGRMKDLTSTLIFQILNMEKKRNSWSSPRNVVTDKSEYIFIRKFATTEEYLQLEIIILFRPIEGNSWNMKIQGPVNIPRIQHGTLKDILKAEGFGKVDLYGDYMFNKFDPSSSVDMIIVARE